MPPAAVCTDILAAHRDDGQHACSHQPTPPAAGGGAVTFGAPMVLYGEDAPKLYGGLQRLEEAAEAAAGKAGHPPLHFHNFVCGSDIVPRQAEADLATWQLHMRS